MHFVFGLSMLHILRRNIWIACGHKSENFVRTTGPRSTFRVLISHSIQFSAKLFSIRFQLLFRRLIMKAMSTQCRGLFIVCLITLIAQTAQFYQEPTPSNDSLSKNIYTQLLRLITWNEKIVQVNCLVSRTRTKFLWNIALWK